MTRWEDYVAFSNGGVEMASMKVTINGTNKNPFIRLGLTCNPFPQLGEYSLDAGEHPVNLLASTQIVSTSQIQSILKGFTPEFVNLCCHKFAPDEVVEFTVHWR